MLAGWWGCGKGKTALFAINVLIGGCLLWESNPIRAFGREASCSAHGNRSQNLYWSSLKITHPLGNWLFTSVVAALTGVFLMGAGVTPETLDGGLYLILRDLFWFGLIVYVVSAMAFLYLRLAPRFRRMPAGSENLKRLQAFISDYPELSQELALDNLLNESVTFGELKKIQKEANRKVVKAATKTLVRGS